jgi:glycerol uptake facilitator-like aquaporin
VNIAVELNGMEIKVMELVRKSAAEFVGTALLVAVVVGSGIIASGMSDDSGLVLLINTISTVFGLAVIIYLFLPISGAHLNPVVSFIQFLRGKLPGRETLAYLVSQTFGAIAGAVLANVMFNQAAIQLSQTARINTGTFVGEVVATSILVLLVSVIGHRRHESLAPVVIAAWIGSAYFFTSSTSFANPAVTVGRIFSDTFAGIEPASAPLFILAQVAGGLLGLMVFKFFINEKREK